MKAKLVFIKGKSESWAEEACAAYVNKISGYLPFERIALKTKSLDRDNAEEKKRLEGKTFLDYFEKSDYVILFDEGGKEFKNSVDFSAMLVKAMGRQMSNLIFVIGGAYGYSQEVKDRANETWSLSRLTMNHHLAQVASLEQIYRALTIWKNFPYHN